MGIMFSCVHSDVQHRCNCGNSICDHFKTSFVTFLAINQSFASRMNDFFREFNILEGNYSVTGRSKKIKSVFSGILGRFYLRSLTLYR